MINKLLWNIPFVNTTWAVAHNSFVNQDYGLFNFNAQQSLRFETLFEKGVRGFMIDLHYHNNDISLCHAFSPNKEPGRYCALHLATLGNPIKLTEFLSSLNNIIVNNPDEIIILFLECYVPMREVIKLFKNYNLTKYLLLENPNNIFTIGNILEKQTRLIVFSDYAYKNEGLQEGGFHNTNQYMESKYNLAEWPGCDSRDESSRASYGSKNLFLLNHFYSTSIVGSYGTINDYFTIKKRVVECEQKFHLFTNFIALDYIEQGNWGGAFKLVDERNYMMFIIYKYNYTFKTKAYTEDQSQLCDNCSSLIGISNTTDDSDEL